MMGAVKEPARNLEADLAICEAATPGPWKQNSSVHHHNSLVWGPMGPGFGTIAESTKYKDNWSENARFIAAAREGWPYAIRRAMKAEEEIDRLRNELNILQEQLGQNGRCWD